METCHRRILYLWRSQRDASLNADCLSLPQNSKTDGKVQRRQNCNKNLTARVLIRQSHKSETVLSKSPHPSQLHLLYSEHLVTGGGAPRLALKGSRCTDFLSGFATSLIFVLVQSEKSEVHVYPTRTSRDGSGLMSLLPTAHYDVKKNE